MNAPGLLAAALVCACCGHAVAQDGGHEAVAVLELGASPARSLTDHKWSIGPTIAVEVSPIERWLELEAGVTASFGGRSTEWSTDLLFKKPWTLSHKIEFMAGIGPEWIRTREHGVTTNSVAAEAAVDFMFWPGRKRRFGWYLEPAFERTLGHTHEHSVSVSAGLLIAIGGRK